MTATRVARRDSLTKSVANNFSIKLPGLVPQATGAWISAPLLNTNIVFTGVNYNFTRSTNPNNWTFRHGPTLWNGRYVGPFGRINGMYRLNN